MEQMLESRSPEQKYATSSSESSSQGSAVSEMLLLRIESSVES